MEYRELEQLQWSYQKRNHNYLTTIWYLKFKNFSSKEGFKKELHFNNLPNWMQKCIMEIVVSNIS